MREGSNLTLNDLKEGPRTSKPFHDHSIGIQYCMIVLAVYIA
jgi:hypothetical protein